MRAFVIIFGLLVIAPTGAEDHVWMIGGGPTPDTSQAQIEFNVNFVLETLRARHPPPQLHVYYTDGDGPGKDVKLWVKPTDSPALLHPLARVFDAHEANGYEYRQHRVIGVRGGTEAGVLSARLANEFSVLKAGDRAMIIYNGHGHRGKFDAAESTLRLWNDTHMSVRELGALLDRVPAEVPVRFVMTQCYSGGFARLMHPQARATLELVAGERCGFMAESETREAEGCSASIEIGDYRDYTTYFFAALRGRTRNGEPIRGNPDRDDDGTVTLYEAHLYVLAEAHNADLPRSTSEVFLERWQPWYLRWFDTGVEPDNIYAALAREVARKNSMPEAGLALARELRERKRDYLERIRVLNNDQEMLKREIETVQMDLRKELVQRWPGVKRPYTRNFAEFLRIDLAAAQDFLRAHPRYPELAAMQDRRMVIERELLHVDRDVTLRDKILRMRKLARLRAQFERHASDSDKAAYKRLVRCEQRPL